MKCKKCGHDIDLHKKGLLNGSYGECSVLGCDCQGHSVPLPQSTGYETYNAEVSFMQQQLYEYLKRPKFSVEMIYRDLAIQIVKEMPMEDLAKLFQFQKFEMPPDTLFHCRIEV